MKQTHAIRTNIPFFQDIVDGKKPFDFRKNDRDYKVGDEIIHIELDPIEQKETGRQCYATIQYILKGGQFGIPEGYVIFTQHTNRQIDYIRDYGVLSNEVLPEFEEKLSYKMGGTIIERANHVLRQLSDTATQSVWKAKNFIDDVKTQFKALELVIEGITGEGNHTQKRIIANHVITMLRSMVDRIDAIDWNYSEGMYQRYNYFRSQSPEGGLMKRYTELQADHNRMKEQFKQLWERPPADQRADDLPF